MMLGLENIQKLNKLFGHPSRKFRSIHVAGTNGKGSVTTKIASSLSCRVGLYTSPHISTFRERIKINGEMIPQERADYYLHMMQGSAATFFEKMTLMAFLYFAEENVDIAVIETGLGGRLDSTNIITPLLSVITTIQFDHTHILGKTLEEIAFEKAGIIKPLIPVLTGPKASFPLFAQRAKELHSPHFIIEETFSDYEKENQAIAKRALEILQLPFSEKGLEVTPPCRFERFEKEIPIILDVAHNPEGFQALFQRLDRKKIHLLMGLGGDKEVESVMKVVACHADFIHLTQASHPRAAGPSVLANILRQQGYDHFSIDVEVSSAFRKAREYALKEGALLCVCGTFFIMSQIRKELGLLEPVDLELMTPY